MRRLLVFLSLMLAGAFAHAELPVSVVDALKKAGIPEQSVAVYVQAVASDGPLLHYNADKSLNPASVMKLVTTNAALELLTPTYRWKTEVYKNGSVTNGVLDGDLIIKGYGDPSFKAQEFWRLLMRLQQAGIKQIKGDLIIDKSVFEKNAGDINTFDDETWRAYNAPPSAFLVNGRSTSFKFTADEAAVKIAQEFELPELQIINNMTLKQGACSAWRNDMRYAVNAFDNRATVIFSGSYTPDCGEKYLELSVFDDEKYAFYSFKKLWRELGGKFNGALKIQATPSTAIKVIEQVSDPLGYVVRDINKWSNNLMARQLLLTIAVENSGAPATEVKGSEAIKTWLASKGLRFDELVIENGSGLSRLERISAEHLGQMLVSAYNGAVMPEFVASMPILSKDGTVIGRLKDSLSNGQAHLKTGSLNGVNAVAGYVLDANGHRHVLVMMVNHVKATASKNAQDALIEWVHQQP
ncbi:MAG: D-alanyl-D-alanine carboxypeptidase/D-alanyl-D-alanine-endopeptidase [Methylotenera sp.]|nr:D-alanyl-D-alanine carboxypeptidase/D-alanyl-D-alanine-endopeptidase [Methylotenera sp.]MDP1960084.1 D-alanyl-D-alanine carboxypeptidase/D-alanyl-D-alanine-endopeptidase [Methylotenera sp.]MDP3206578.1 D-alanyl-D-alanine carboxypeptidase/D-alanyl-D-alanine-endopeptidase [Methylotenera sp.]MDP3304443.1 D-alanyl-D-alanine carboxypeptidase/D-alanyl-D-alanine-endopeptidase [Methylotenera sp.]MDP3942098.1 D-alanyl-D-alanine carboxypeptidase/D-alanyl-D-alanine-endopeptidase [Methylotenera sp.]